MKSTIPDNGPAFSLLMLLVGSEKLVNIHNQEAFRKYSGWYLQHLNNRINHWIRNDGLNESVALFVSQVHDTSSRKPTAADIIRGLEAVANSITLGSSLLSIAQSCAPTSNYSPHQDEDKHQFLRRFLPSKSTGSNVLKQYQFLFLAISWLSMLYTPARKPPLTYLQLEFVDSTERTKKLHTHTWKSMSSTITDELVSLNFEHLMNRFGRIDLSALHKSSFDKPARNEQILASNMNYFILSKVAGIKVVWVDSLSLHLEFDRRTLTLKLFQFPSFCAMHAIPKDPHKNIFDYLFPDRNIADNESSIGDIEVSSPFGTEFFQEVLCSYRLIFSQHKFARRLYQKHMAGLATPQIDIDPLREQICGKSKARITVFDEINAFPEKAIYSSRWDFPHLGQKLLAVQDFVEAHNPGDYATLWYDIRDLNRFYTFWAVILVGAISIFLSLVQCIIGGLQLRTIY